MPGRVAGTHLLSQSRQLNNSADQRRSLTPVWPCS